MALRYVLSPDPATARAIVETVRDYAVMMEMLAEIAAGGEAGANLVLLHEQAYERIRAATRLPAQMVVLGLRDFVARRHGLEVPGLPLDDKLYAIKGATVLTVTTVAGRVVVPYDVHGYREGWRGSIPARLVVETERDGGERMEIQVGVTPHHAHMEEKPMVHEGILSRMGRLIAGFAHTAVDRAEGADPVSVVEQAIREMDAAADEARAELGRATAEKFRIDSRRAEIDAEGRGLDEKIRSAVEHGRDDLAKTGINRQMDLEAQLGALDKALADVDERIAESRQALQAVTATREDAEERLRDLKRSQAAAAPTAGPAGPPRPTPGDRAHRSAAAVARVTGVPNGAPPTDAAGLDELERLHRARQVEQRLAAVKAKS